MIFEWSLSRTKAIPVNCHIWPFSKVVLCQIQIVLWQVLLVETEETLAASHGDQLEREVEVVTLVDLFVTLW